MTASELSPLSTGDADAIKYRAERWVKSLRNLRKKRGDRVYKLTVSRIIDALVEMEKEPLEVAV